jgi:hypothetical protein
MRTSLNNISETERYLTGKLTAEEALQFTVKLLVNPLQRTDVAIQDKIYLLIRFFGRKKLRSELEAIHDKTFSGTDGHQLQSEMEKLFSK